MDNLARVATALIDRVQGAFAIRLHRAAATILTRAGMLARIAAAIAIIPLAATTTDGAVRPSTTTFVIASTKGLALDVIYNGPVQCPSGCSGFTMYDATAGSYIYPYGGMVDSSNPDQVDLLLSVVPAASDVLTLSYGPGTVEDTSGNPLASFASQFVTNQNGVPAASFVSASTKGLTLKVLYSGPVQCANGCSGFTMYDPTAGSYIYPYGGTVDANNPDQVDLILSVAPAASDALNLNYGPGTVEDANGDPLASFANQPVTNQNGAPTVTFTSASVKGLALKVLYNGPVQCANGCGGFTMYDGTAGSYIYPYGGMVDANNADQVDLLLSVAPAASDVVSLSYGPGTVEDSNGDPLASFSSQPVTNQNGAPPAIVISPMSGVFGQTLTFTGSNFRSSELVNVYADSAGTVPLASATAGTDGSFVVTGTIPQDVAGAHAIIAVGATSGLSATTSLTISPTISLLRSSGIQSSRDVISGYGFAANESVKATWKTQHGIVLGLATTNALGTFTGATAITFTVPMSPTGSYNVIAVGQTSGSVVTSTFTLNPYLRVSPTSGAHGSKATISGTGYGAREVVRVKWNCASATCGGTTLLGSRTTDRHGNFTGLRVTIPATASVGTYPIGGIGATSGAFAQTYFTVTS